MKIPSIPTVDPGQRQVWLQLVGWMKDTEFRLSALENKPDPVSVPPQLGGGNAISSTAVAIAADRTLLATEINQWYVFNCTSDCAVTLPTPMEGGFIWIANVGTSVLTVKTNVGTLAPTLHQGGYCFLPTITDSTGVAKWPTGMVVFGFNGSITLAQNVTIDSTTYGLVEKDTNGHYWLDTVSVAGAHSTADQGTNIPPEI